MPNPTWTEEVYQGQHSVDALLHQTSLQLAMAWHSSQKNNCSPEVSDDLLEAYIKTRRAIHTRDENGSRFGARAAYHAMQGEYPDMYKADPKTGLSRMMKYDQPFPLAYNPS
jgi:hypothetical protein